MRDLVTLEKILVCKEFTGEDLGMVVQEFDGKIYKEMEESMKPMKIGYFEYDEYFTCTDPIIETMRLC